MIRPQSARRPIDVGQRVRGDIGSEGHHRNRVAEDFGSGGGIAE